jgi:hypothetical protein
MANPKMTRFKSMSLDEKVTAMEKSAQGALRSREEIIAAETAEAPQEAVETTEISQVTPVQDRISPEAQDAWERGLLMHEKAQRMMNHM